MRQLFFMSLLLLAGCSTTWRNTHLTDTSAHDRQLKIDDAYCSQVSYGAVPMPPARVYRPQQQEYVITGTATTYDQSSNSYSQSNYRANVSRASGGFAQGFSEGFQNGSEIGGAIAAKMQRNKIHEGCMLQLGWDKVE